MATPHERSETEIVNAFYTYVSPSLVPGSGAFALQKVGANFDSIGLITELSLNLLHTPAIYKLVG